MSDDEQSPPLTELLHAWKKGDGAAFAQVIDAAYEQLRKMAESRLRGDNALVTLVPTELLHEAVIRAMEAVPDLANRAHFFATMSLLMRSVLVDRARARLADKRGGGAVKVTLTESAFGEESIAIDLLALDQALTKLQALDERGCRILEMTYFGGLERDEIARVLRVSVPTVDRDLKFARAWLNKSIGHGA
jgi:RNA polymerase sigma factor (TIGR02999 family)